MPPLSRRLLAASATLLALAVPSVASAADCPGADGAAAGAQSVAATICLINGERANVGLAPLGETPELDSAASGHAGDMVQRQYFDHTSPDGGTLLDRLTAASWVPASGDWTAGEDIAWGSGDQGTPRGIVAAWMASQGHRENILRPTFTEIGVGVAVGAPQAGVNGAAGTYVADFGARESAAPAAPAKPAAAANGPAGHASRGAVARRRAASCTRRSRKHATPRCARTSRHR